MHDIEITTQDIIEIIQKILDSTNTQANISHKFRNISLQFNTPLSDQDPFLTCLKEDRVAHTLSADRKKLTLLNPLTQIDEFFSIQIALEIDLIINPLFSPNGTPLEKTTTHDLVSRGVRPDIKFGDIHMLDKIYLTKGKETPSERVFNYFINNSFPSLPTLDWLVERAHDLEPPLLWIAASISWDEQKSDDAIFYYTLGLYRLIAALKKLNALPDFKPNLSWLEDTFKKFLFGTILIQYFPIKNLPSWATLLFNNLHNPVTLQALQKRLAPYQETTHTPYWIANRIYPVAICQTNPSFFKPSEECREIDEKLMAEFTSNTYNTIKLSAKVLKT